MSEKQGMQHYRGLFTDVCGIMLCSGTSRTIVHIEKQCSIIVFHQYMISRLYRCLLDRRTRQNLILMTHHINNKAILDSRLHRRSHILTNSTKHCSCLMSN